MIVLASPASVAPFVHALLELGLPLPLAAGRPRERSVNFFNRQFNARHRNRVTAKGPSIPADRADRRVVYELTDAARLRHIK